MKVSNCDLTAETNSQGSLGSDTSADALHKKAHAQDGGDCLAQEAKGNVRAACATAMGGHSHCRAQKGCLSEAQMRHALPETLEGRASSQD